MSEWKLPTIQMPDPHCFRPILVVVNLTGGYGNPMLHTVVAYVSPTNAYSKCRIIPARGYGAVGDGVSVERVIDLENIVCWRELPDGELVAAEMGVL